MTRYTARAVDAQRFSVKSEVYKKLASGVMGLLFYATYTVAFTYGTYQVRNNRDLSPYSQSLP